MGLGSGLEVIRNGSEQIGSGFRGSGLLVGRIRHSFSVKRVKFASIYLILYFGWTPDKVCLQGQCEGGG